MATLNNAFKSKDISMSSLGVSPAMPDDYKTGKVLHTQEVVTNKFKLTTSPTNGYVLQSDASGNGTWVDAGGTGTVTSASIVTANGVSGTTATPTTTPAHTITLGAITPTSMSGATIYNGTISGATFVDAALGTPLSGVMTNVTGTAASLTAGLATDTVTKTGTGSTYATNTSPTFVTPALGTPASGTLTSCTGLPEAGLTLADNTTANSSTTAHGFLKKLDNTATNFMNGAGNWAVPAGGDIVISSANAVSYATGATVVLGTSISGYRHLKLIYNFEGTDASTGTTTVIRFNGDAGANYAWLSASPTKANVTGQTGITISNALRTAILAGGQMLVNVVDSGAANIHTFTGANYTSGNVGITHWSEGGSYTADGDVTAISLVVTGTGNTVGNWVLYGVN